ncbi:MAG: L-seryl-tRNA(Sec) selenium transferase [Dehalococcoidia bacterium]|nr:MAG: L-seryl-tRNA(Sec) selenium transferase [Dehalococcoidia bacterium]
MNAPKSPRAKTEAGTALRRLPAVEKLLESPELAPDIARYSRPLVTQAARHVLSELRAGIKEGNKSRRSADVIKLIKEHLSSEWPAFMSPVINGTGVILHTNLGRAPLSQKALEAVATLGGQYFNLESDLEGGGRGTRALELRRLLALLTGAEDAVVVNNNAAAVLLVLVALAHGKEAVVSRGELVQIGGGFRVPEIMEQSGVTLREVGATNQTSLRDYEKGIGDKTALILKVHPSNFVQKGFVSEVGINELAGLARRRNLPLVYDLGSGAMLDTADFGLEHEPTVQETLRDGADLVCFSGDKLLGGPQAGIVAGKRKLIQPLLKHPLMRVIRLDKLSAAALEATVKSYLDKTAISDIPVWRMMSAVLPELQTRAKAIIRKLKTSGIVTELKSGVSMVGGGTLPEQSLATALVCIKPEGSAEAFSRSLRLSQPPLVSRVENDTILIDMRTIFPEQDMLLVSIIQAARARKD